MPILHDVMDHELFGPVLRQARAEGRSEGRSEGLIEGERQILLRLISRRFGPLPDWARKRVGVMQASDLERIALLVLDATSLEDLLR